MNRKQLASQQIKTAIDQLKLAEANLRYDRNDMHIHVDTQILILRIIYDKIMDRIRTPEEVNDDEQSL